MACRPRMVTEMVPNEQSKGSRKSMKSIDEDIRTGNFKRVYLLYGKEHYLIRRYRDKLRNALAAGGDEMNVTVFEGKDVVFGEVIDLAETLPFLAEYRVIILENTGFFKKGQDELAEYVKQIPDTTCLIFVEEQVDKVRKPYKAVAKVGRAVEFGEQKDEVLARWVSGRIRREGKNITRGAYQLFISRTGTDMENIDRELEKLLCYTLDRDVIVPEDVEAVTTEQLSTRIFVLVDAIVEHQPKRALDLFCDLMAQKESPLGILAMLERQFQALLIVKSMSNHGFSQKEIIQKSSMEAWKVQRYIRQARGFSLQQLRQALLDGAEYEEAVKTGRMIDRIALELFITKYSSSGEPTGGGGR